MNLQELSVASFNLMNLNEAGRPLYADTNGWTAAEFALKIEWTAHNLRVLKSDVFGFQELWHPAPLAAALDQSGLAAEYDMLVPPSADGSKIVVEELVQPRFCIRQLALVDHEPRFGTAGDDFVEHRLE